MWDSLQGIPLYKEVDSKFHVRRDEINTFGGDIRDFLQREHNR